MVSSHVSKGAKPKCGDWRTIDTSSDNCIDRNQEWRSSGRLRPRMHDEKEPKRVTGEGIFQLKTKPLGLSPDMAKNRAGLSQTPWLIYNQASPYAAGLSLFREEGMSILYFAYGSNMLTARLLDRCHSAKVIGAASATDRALSFTKPSIDSSGKATLDVSAQGVNTPGVLFEIARSDLPSLDKAEGAGIGYDRHDDFRVYRSGTNEEIAATTYLAAKTEAHLKPYDWYLALVIAGAHQHDLEAAHTQMLGQTEFIVDDDVQRKGRTVALRALAKHEHTDYRRLLRRFRDPASGLSQDRSEF